MQHLRYKAKIKDKTRNTTSKRQGKDKSRNLQDTK